MDEVLVSVESADPLIARLVSFCDQHDVEASAARFCHRHVEAFDSLDTGEDGEIAHAVFELFHRFETLFADVVAAFLTREGLTPDGFFEHCDALKTAQPSNSAALDNLQLLLRASLDLDAFCRLMRREARETQAAREDAAAMGLL